MDWASMTFGGPEIMLVPSPGGSSGPLERRAQLAVATQPLWCERVAPDLAA
jgi:hypothetical protein